MAGEGVEEAVELPGDRIRARGRGAASIRGGGGGSGRRRPGVGMTARFRGSGGGSGRRRPGVGITAARGAREGGRGGARSREERADRGPAEPRAVAAATCHVAAREWTGRAADGGIFVRRRADTSGRAEISFSRVRGGLNREFWRGGVYIGIKGARRVQMRCVFRPRDRDRTL